MMMISIKMQLKFISLMLLITSKAEEAERAILLKEDELRELHERQKEPVVVEPVEVKLQNMEVAVSWK